MIGIHEMTCRENGKNMFKNIVDQVQLEIRNGLSPDESIKKIAKKFDLDMSGDTVSRLYNIFMSKKTESFKSDKEINKLYLDKLTPEEIDQLPDNFLCVARQPGASYYIPVFDIVNKQRFIDNPEKCFFIDSYWGYEYPHNIRIATSSELEDYRKKRLDEINNEVNKLKKSCII